MKLVYVYDWKRMKMRIEINVVVILLRYCLMIFYWSYSDVVLLWIFIILENKRCVVSELVYVVEMFVSDDGKFIILV